MTTQPTRNSLPNLWEQAVVLWNNLVLGFGHPVDLMRWGWMRAVEHRGLTHWVRNLENLIRRAIRADAHELELPTPKTRARRRCPRPHQSHEDMPRFRRSYSDDCTTWKVSFRMHVPVARKRTGPRKASAPPERRRCRNLAYRIEALRRAISYREDYVLRYARRLARIAQSRIVETGIHDPGRTLSVYDPSQPATAAASPVAAPQSAKYIEPG